MDPLASTLLILLVSLLLVFALLDVRKPRKYPPGPLWLPVIGSFWAYHFLIKKCKYTHLVWKHLEDMYGPVVGLRMGKDPIVVVSGYPLVKEVLGREEFEGRPDGFLFRLRAFGKRLGVVFTDGSFGQEQRRFMLKHLRDLGLGRSSLQNTIADETQQFIACLQEKSKSGPVDVKSVLNVSILNNLWAMMAGKRFSIDDRKLSQLLDYVHEGFSLQDMSGGLLNQMPFIRYIAPERSNYNKIIKIINSLESFMVETIDEHKKTLNPNYIRDFIDAFLLEMERNKDNKESNFTEEQLLILLADIFMAGSDTTSNTLSFCILHMLHNPSVQDKLAAEVLSVSDGHRPPTINQRAQMPYTEAFIMEVQRYTSVATVTVAHRCKQDSIVDSYIIPKNTTMLMDLYSIHMDKAHWGDPDTFRPERFLNTENQLVHDEWLIPFGLGRRRCLGETLARPTLFLFLTSLVFHFKMSFTPGTPLPTLEPIDGAILASQTFSCILTPQNSFTSTLSNKEKIGQGPFKNGSTPLITLYGNVPERHYSFSDILLHSLKG